MSVPLPQRADTGFHDVLGCIEIGLADLHMDDLPALRLQGPRLRQHLEGRLGAQVHHAAGYSHGSSLLETGSDAGLDTGIDTD